MNDAEGYDVLRLIEHNRGCYISSEYVKGSPLVRWLKYHPNLSKEQLLLWIHEMARQLQCIHRCRGNPCYRYVNPYSVIITEEKKLYFLDMNAESNSSALRRMQRRNVREYFLPPGEDYYQTESVELDIYGLGKTIQYLLSISEPEPPLTRREEARFHKIISRCLCRQSGKAYSQVSELYRQLPVCRTPCKKITKKKKILFVSAALLFVGVSAFFRFPASFFSVQKQTEQLLEADADMDSQNGEKEETEEKEELMEELGFLYFLDKKDYGKSKEYFSGISSHLAESMARLAEYMQKGKVTDAKELGNILQEIEKEVPEQKKYNYYRCLLEVYRILDSQTDEEAVLRLGEYCLEREKDEGEKKEIISIMASAADRAGDVSQATESYLKLLELEKEEKEREALYKKIVALYEVSEESEKAGQLCRQGIEELPDSKELRIIHMRMLCALPSVERQECAQIIKEYLNELPEIAEEQEFQKLMQEYDITLEGENVWVGR